VGDEATFSLKNKSETKTEEETLENAMVPLQLSMRCLNEVGLSHQPIKTPHRCVLELQTEIAIIQWVKKKETRHGIIF
jgi:hypothetical protein